MSEVSKFVPEREQYTLNYFIDRFTWFRDEHSDELPAERTDTLMLKTGKSYKARGNFLLGLYGTIQQLQSSGLVDDEFSSQCREYLRNLDFPFAKAERGEYFNQEDINTINTVLDALISELKTKL